MLKAKKIISVLMVVVIAMTAVHIPAGAAEQSFEKYVLGKFKDFSSTLNVSKYMKDRKYTADEKGLSKLIDDLNAILWENPDIFFVDYYGWADSLGYVYFQTDSTYKYIAELDKVPYTIKKSEYKKEKSKFDKAVKKAVDAAYGCDTEAEKVLAVHDYIILNCKYDISSINTWNNTISDPDVNTAYGAFVNGKAICGGYSMAFSQAMSKLKVKCTYISSYKMDPAHMWNYVRVDKKWYHLDVTFDDPMFTEDEEMFGFVGHDNILLSDKAIKKTEHKGWEMRDLSKSSNTKYDKFFWKQKEVVSAMVHLGDYWYYVVTDEDSPFIKGKDNIIHGNLRRYSFDTGKHKTLYTIKSKPWQFGRDTGFTISLSSLSEYNGLLYYNTPDAVYSIKPDGKSAKSVFKNKNSNDIFGINIVGSKLYYSNRNGLEAQDKISNKSLTKAKAETLKLSSKKSISVGKTTTLKVTQNPSSASDYIYWATSDPSVATVDEKGKVTAVSKGKCVITAKNASGKKAECNVTVK